MLVSIQDLRSIQERCEIGELVQRLDVSIDVLIQNLPKLNTELQLLVGEFLNLENK